MSTSTNFHRAKIMMPHAKGETAWLEVEDGRGNSLSIFMPLVAAQMMAAAWEQYRDFVAPRMDDDDDVEDEPEPLDAETVAQRQSYTECQIVAAGRGELL